MKTELATVANQYAQAILELAFKQGAEPLADKVLSELSAINKVILNTADMEVVLQHPAIDRKRKRQLLTGTFQTIVSDLTMRVLELLLDKRRLNLLPQIETGHHQMLNAKKNIVSASLICADKLDDGAIANIKARLTEHLGKRLELDV